MLIGTSIQRRNRYHGIPDSFRFWIFWIDASSVETMEQSFKAIAGESVAQAAGVEASAISVKRWLSCIDQEWLLIFDNADGDPNHVGKYIPPGTRGNILLTSRNPMMDHHVPSPNARVEVDAMDEEDAIALLLKSAKLDDSPSDLTAPARDIVTMLYCLPLAIDQAGAAISSNMCTIHDYPQLYALHRCELLMFRSFDGVSDSDRAVYTTWNMSYMAIHADASGTSDLPQAQAAKCAIMLLELFAFLHHENISEEIMRRAAVAPPCEPKFPTETEEGVPDQDAPDEAAQQLVFSELLRLDHSGKWDPLFFRGGIRILRSFSLIKKSASGDTYFEHPLVHLWSRDRLSDAIQRTRRRLTSELLAQSITCGNHATDYAFRRDVIPHIESCAAGPSWTRIYKEEEYIKFALAYDENGFLKEAEELYIRVLEIRKRVRGEEHPDALKTMQDLASTYKKRGRYREAEELEVRVLEIRKRVLGEEHLDTLMSMANLAETYNKRGRNEEAEELEVRVLEIRKRVLGEEHFETLRSMANLAFTYDQQSRYEEAEELSVRVLEMKMRVLGEEHPNTLVSMNNLAGAYHQRGRYKEAEELLGRVLEIRKRVLAEEHPDTLVSMANLAAMYGKRGRYGEAEELEVQVLEIWKRVLGEEHPDTLVSMGNLAVTYKRRGRHEEAEELEVRALEIWKRVLAEDHPDILRSTANLAVTYKMRGKHEEAEELEVRVLEIRKRVLGEEHSDTLTSMANLAVTYRKRGRHEEAEELEVRVLEIRKRVLGEEHPNTLVSMANLAVTYRTRGRQEEAEELSVRALEIQRRVLGEEHLGALATMNHLAWIWKDLGRNQDALELMQKTVDLSRKTLGPRHPDTVEWAKDLEESFVTNMNFDYTLGSLFARWHYLPTTILVLILACSLLPILSSFRM